MTKIIIFIFLTLTLSVCEKETTKIFDLEGTWMNTVNDNDVLIFRNDTLLERGIKNTGSHLDYHLDNVTITDF